MRWSAFAAGFYIKCVCCNSVLLGRLPPHCVLPSSSTNSKRRLVHENYTRRPLAKKGVHKQGSQTEPNLHKQGLEVQHKRNHTETAETHKESSQTGPRQTRSPTKHGPDTFKKMCANRAATRNILHKQDVDSEGDYTDREQTHKEPSRQDPKQRNFHKQSLNAHEIYTRRPLARRDLNKQGPHTKAICASKA